MKLKGHEPKILINGETQFGEQEHVESRKGSIGGKRHGTRNELGTA